MKKLYRFLTYFESSGPSIFKKMVSQQIGLLLFLFVIVFYNCTKDEAATRFYPRLSTLNATEIQQSAAKFNAEIISGDHAEVQEYGFTWNQNISPNLDSDENIKVTGSLKEKNFSCIVQTLQKGQNYHVRSFIRTNKLLIYGTEVLFSTLK